jgi:hypothetical protein
LGTQQCTALFVQVATFILYNEAISATVKTRGKKMRPSEMRIQKFLTQYNAFCIGHFDYSPGEKCNFCPKSLEKAYYYFQGEKIDSKSATDKDIIYFCTGPSCGKNLAKLLNIKLPSSFSIYETESQNTTQNEIISTSSSTKQQKLLPIIKQFHDALRVFVTIKKAKPTPYIGMLLRKIHQGDGTELELSKHIVVFNRIINEDFKGTLTEELIKFGKQKGTPLRIFKFDLLREECKKQGKQSYY